MKNQALRSLMIENKTFLAELYLRDNIQVRKEIVLTSEKRLRLIILILQKISCGEIPLPKEAIAKLSQTRKKAKLHQLFGSKSKVNELMVADRKTKVETLLKFSNCFNLLFYWIFNDPSKKNK